MSTVTSAASRPEVKISEDKDACGVGVVADMNGVASHQILEDGLEATASVPHRGGIGADNRTTDGVGIKVEVDQDFFRGEHAKAVSEDRVINDIAVAQLFLPQDEALRHSCYEIMNDALTEAGYTSTSWRDVPHDTSVLGEDAKQTLPYMQQLLIEQPDSVGNAQFKRDLLVIRRRIEKRVEAADLTGEDRDMFYIPSMSKEGVVYKGLSLAADLGNFYPDLKNPEYKTRYAQFHVRFSTNTSPAPNRAHPYRVLAHNGEINTLRGNLNDMPIRENALRAKFGEDADDILPVIQPGGSDSANLDNALEADIASGTSLPATKIKHIPPAVLESSHYPQDVQDMLALVDAGPGPWDGPAMFIMSDDDMVLVGGDRLGMRPTRWGLTTKGTFVAGSEAGMVNFPRHVLAQTGNLTPGEDIAVDLKNGGVIRDPELKAMAAAEIMDDGAKAALEKITDLDRNADYKPEYKFAHSIDGIREQQRLAGFTYESVNKVIDPMILDGKEALGSMGRSTQKAALSHEYFPLYRYFKQRFAQVTNPPVDPIREKPFTSTVAHLGALSKPDGRASDAGVMRLDSPIVTNKDFAQIQDFYGDSLATIDCVFDPKTQSMEDALADIREQAAAAAAEGQQIVLSHEKTDSTHVPLPMMLAVSTVHTDLLKRDLRGFTSISARPIDCHDTHDFACIIGMGANTVNAYLAEETIVALHARTKINIETEEEEPFYGDTPLETCVENYRKAVTAGVLKIMSKMGISHAASYQGARLFEADGLNKDFVSTHFPGVPSKVSGIDALEIQRRLVDHHDKVVGTPGAKTLPAGGRLSVLNNEGETQAYLAEHIGALQKAISHYDVVEGYKLFEEYEAKLAAHHQETNIYYRDLLDIIESDQPLDLSEVEAENEIVKRLLTGAMSHGSISKEVHEALAVAMNRIGGKSNSGEGGQDPSRDGTEKQSAAVQVASGRFDVTMGYLNGTRNPETRNKKDRQKVKQIQIKMAQGAKPGEGGQLMGFKVIGDIPKLRHCKEGTTLVSPPPHHDIYSIEDLAQLIYDLKKANSEARVSVKLVASDGVDTIAVGVAKAGADEIHVSGGDGGTGASPQTSISYAGMDWDTHVKGVHEALIENGLRGRVLLTTDGGMRRGRDFFIAAAMGGEGFALGTHALIAQGCALMRQCQTGKCAYGVATSDPELRLVFFKNHLQLQVQQLKERGQDVGQELHRMGQIEALLDLYPKNLEAEIDPTFKARLDPKIDAFLKEHNDEILELVVPKIINMAKFSARSMRHQMAKCGIRSVDELIGRTDLLTQARGFDRGIDMKEVLAPIANAEGNATKCELKDGERNEYINPANPNYVSVDERVISDGIVDYIVAGKRAELIRPVTLEDRDVGTELSEKLSNIFGQAALAHDTVTLNLTGYAGQSLGMGAIQGVTINMLGEAQDGVGKALSGGIIALRQEPGTVLEANSQGNTIMGAACGYGAIHGEMYAAGRAGNRFAVRLSGATAVVEGTDDNACEYMTAGTVAILGETGRNFGAAMSGGEAFVYDPKHTLKDTANIGIRKDIRDIKSNQAEQRLKDLITEHVKRTGSKWAQSMLNDWNNAVQNFRHVVPTKVPKAANDHPMSATPAVA